MRSQFINAQEILLIMVHDGTGEMSPESTYLHENFATPECALAAVEQSYFAERFDDPAIGIQNIYRWEPGTMPENITDDIAHAYRKVHNISVRDAWKLPEWVRLSAYWDDYCEVHGIAVA